MSTGERIKVKLENVKRIESEIATCLLENPQCLDGDSQKNEAYKMSIQYFVDKQEACQSSGEESYNWAESIRLGVLIDCYTDEVGKKKIGYIQKIASFLLQMPEDSLRLIPDETKNDAFYIVIRYLEEQMDS